MNGKKKERGWRLAGEPASTVELSPAEERAFLERFSRLKGRFNMESKSPIGVSVTVMRTRENAARLSVPLFLRQCGGPREDVLDALMEAVSLPVRLLEWYGDPDSLYLGAACWFLDYVEQKNLKKSLLFLLPPAPEDEDFSIPVALDPAWPREAICQVTNVLRNRKERCIKEFRHLLKLIKKEDAAALRAAFRDALLDYFRRFCEIQSRVKPASKPEAEPAFPLTPLPAASHFFDKKKEIPPYLDMKSFAEDTPGVHFLLRTPELLGASPEKIQSVLYIRRMTERLADYSVADPYAICAAYLLLEEEKDLLCSLGTLTDIVLLSALRLLPWSMQEAEYAFPLWKDTPPDHRPRFLFHPPDLTDEDDDQPMMGDEIEDGELLSEAQIFYLATGYLLPRNCTPSADLTAWFVKQGIPEVRARELSAAALLVSRQYAFMDWDEYRQGYADMVENPPRTVSLPRKGSRSPARDMLAETGGKAGRTAEPEAASQEDSRVSQLTREVKNARNALHDAELTIRQLREQLTDVERAATQNKLELNSLRDTLFRMRSAEQQPEEAQPEESVEFPWTGRRRILVFGGHDTWSKVIRPLLPAVRFCDREALPDLNAIKSADIVWIQPNALSHKFYYRIIETARKEGIPVRYFGFASARKCAEQLVEVELAAEDG